jgi:cellobiose phosphorylase
MSFGHFDDQRREYVITRPDTPLPWFNYLGHEDFFGIITNTAGGYCFYRDARLRRLTRYRYNNVPLDTNGRYLYIKDGDTIWNPSWKPTRTQLDRYECRHGLGYTQITGERDGVEVVVRYFVPRGVNTELWDVTVRNTSGGKKCIQVFAFVEWCLWNAFDDMTNYQRNYSIGQVEVEEAAIFHVTEYRERRNHFAYFSCNAKTDGFDTARDAFVGVHEALDRPIAVVNGKCTGSIAHGWAPVGAHQINLQIEPGATRRATFLLGYCENPDAKKYLKPGVVNKAPFHKVARLFDTPAKVDAAFEKLRSHWDELLSIYQVRIDDPHVSRMANVWNPYQCMVTLNLSRSASGYETGIGRGMGYRDSNQDLLGVVHLQPKRARERLLDIAATQLSDGTCYHQYQPLTKKGNSDAGSGFNDDPLWLPMSVAAYLAETGDTGVLREKIGYADKGNTDGATLMDHLEISMNYTLKNLGPHKLPLIGHADWNDCLNLNCFSKSPGESFQNAGDIQGSIAESVMIAGQFCVACQKMAEIYQQVGQKKKASEVLTKRDDMLRAIDKSAWDGEWFLRAYDARGKKIGSKTNKEGRIFIESQGWCVLGGVGLDDGRARKALDSVKKHLAGPNGIVLQQPAYATYHVELGEVSSYPPGYKENAGIFTHNNTWIWIAETMLGDGDQAFKYWLSVCPSNKESQIETYRAEPYVYSQMTAGPDAPTSGEAKNSWLTGTAAWTFVAISQFILGVRPSPQGLTVDPCIPRNWKGYMVQRKFRGKTYQIEVRNPNGVSRGVESLTVNGKRIEGNTIPLNTRGKMVQVIAELG